MCESGWEGASERQGEGERKGEGASVCERERKGRVCEAQ